MKSSAVLPVLYLIPALESSVVILHSQHAAALFFFSSHCFWSIEKAHCVLSVTSCGSIYLSLSHQCTILYLHKKGCVCVCVSLSEWVWLVAALVRLVCTGRGRRSTASAAKWTPERHQLCLSILCMSCSPSNPATLWRSHNQADGEGSYHWFYMYLFIYILYWHLDLLTTNTAAFHTVYHW